MSSVEIRRLPNVSVSKRPETDLTDSYSKNFIDRMNYSKTHIHSATYNYSKTDRYSRNYYKTYSYSQICSTTPGYCKKEGYSNLDPGSNENHPATSRKRIILRKKQSKDPDSQYHL